MLKYYGAIRQAAQHLAKAANSAMKDYKENMVEHEPEITNRMLGRISQAMERYESKGILWRSKTLTSALSNSQESIVGADFAGVLDINLNDYNVKKGFLAQAKRIEDTDYFGRKEYNRLIGQCKQMLEYTSAAYVFIYSRSGITVVPAMAVVATESYNICSLYNRTVSRFFEEHFECFIGDHRLKGPSIEDIDSLKHIEEPHRLLLISATNVR